MKEAAGVRQRPKSREETPKEGCGALGATRLDLIVRCSTSRALADFLPVSERGAVCEGKLERPRGATMTDKACF